MGGIGDVHTLPLERLGADEVQVELVHADHRHELAEHGARSWSFACTISPGTGTTIAVGQRRSACDIGIPACTRRAT
jgi:hypothetical protein